MSIELQNVRRGDLVRQEVSNPLSSFTMRVMCDPFFEHNTIPAVLCEWTGDDGQREEKVFVLSELVKVM
jgi:hypothetical protein